VRERQKEGGREGDMDEGRERGRGISPNIASLISLRDPRNIFPSCRDSWSKQARICKWPRSEVSEAINEESIILD